MSLHCHRCYVWIPDNEHHCPHCGACANCSLLETESSALAATIAFCPSCGVGLLIRRPRQGIDLWVWLLLRGSALTVLAPIAVFSGMGALCMAFDMRRADDVIGAVVFSAVCGLSVWAIITLSRKQP